jgi:ADP-ribose pyrophosphatase YjhB (NUDIX family)
MAASTIFTLIKEIGYPRFRRDVFRDRVPMKFCSECGSRVALLVPGGDDRLRHVCRNCGIVHYQNPKIVVGCVPAWEEKVLLCRRAIQPRSGLWTLPAGFMEKGETVQQGAARETLEEAHARVEVGKLYGLFNLPHIDQVYLMFLSRLLDLEYAPGAESLEVDLFAESEVPWDELAFPIVIETLRLYFHDRANGEHTLRSGDIVRPDGDMGRYNFNLRQDD